MDIINRVYKDILGFEGLYLISNYGEVFSLITNRVRPTTSKNQFGHLAITLRKDKKTYKKYVHRMVAQAFLPNPDNKRQVHHIDFNPKNNIVTNLKWATSLEDCLYTSNANRGGGSVKPKKPVYCFSKDGALLTKYDSMRDAERKTGASQQDISRQILGKKYYAGGFIWKLENN